MSIYDIENVNRKMNEIIVLSQVDYSEKSKLEKKNSIERESFI